MPGIAGIIINDIGFDHNELLIKKMLDAITHYDWYITSHYVNENFAVGSVGLYAVNGGQPSFSKDGTLCAIMDGEILNGDDLKRELLSNGYEVNLNNDLDLSLYLYGIHGEGFVKKLNGSFTIVIMDKKNQKLVIINDRYGLRPLYYANYKNKFLFCSEVKGILKDSDFDKEIDEAAIADFFSFGYVLGDKTLFKNIRVLPQASILTYRDGRISLNQYWDFEYKENYTSHSLDDYLEEFAFLLHQAVNRCMKGDYVVGVPLSGGLDSRMIVGMIDKKYLPIHTFTYGVPGCNDLRFARRVSEEIGTLHHEVTLKCEYFDEYIKKGVFLTDGMISCIHFQTMSILDEMKNWVQVALGGILGDVTSGDHLRHSLFSINDRSNLLYALYKYHDILGEDIRRLLFLNSYYQRIKAIPFESVEYSLAKTKAQLSANICDSFDIRERQRRFINYGNINLRSKVEVRTPFFDNDLIDFYLALPPDLRVAQRLYKEVFKRKLPNIAKIPRQSTELPIDCSRFQEILKRAESIAKWRIEKLCLRKVRFPNRRRPTDYDGWFRTCLKDFIQNTLLSKEALSRGYFNYDFIRGLVDAHMSGKANYSVQIGCLVTFELWHRMFIDSSYPVGEVFYPRVSYEKAL
jgi:asparagine synthase (glutamine-hydrolysing)